MKTSPRLLSLIVPAVVLAMVGLLFALTAAGGLLQTFGGDGEYDTGLSGSEGRSPSSEGSRVSAAASMGALGLDLYEILARDADDDNVVFSPASIATALAMTYAGAAGTTADEMARTLHLARDGVSPHRAFGDLAAQLKSRNRQEVDVRGRDASIDIRTANSLWGQHDTVFEPAFLDTLANDYGAAMRLVDYKSHPEQARESINGWVADETSDKITDLVPVGILHQNTRLVLVNAVYLDATWASQFEPRATADGVFTTLTGAFVTASMMHQSAKFPYAARDDWQAVELPYVGGELSMLLLVPDAGRFEDVQRRLKDGLLDEAVAALASRPVVNLAMPKFEFRTTAPLADALEELGMVESFDPGKADFSGMAADERLYLSSVVHEAWIAVGEEGTEAAGATAAVVGVMMGPAEVVDLTIDRPFIFALRDRATGALLFFGRVTDPTS